MTNYIFVAIVSAFFTFLEYCQHKDHERKYPDAPCHSAVIGFVIIVIMCVIFAFKGD